MTKQTNFEAGLMQELRQLEASTEAADLFRLAQGRNQALIQKKAQGIRLAWPTAGVALASLILFAAVLPEQNITAVDIQLVNGSIDNGTLANETIDLYEDPDFYYWLADIEDGSGN